MDYGYQLLRHVVQQVFGNLGAAARLTLAPMVIGAVILSAIVLGIVTPALRGGQGGGSTSPLIGPGASSPTEVGIVALAALIAILVWLVVYAWAAVSWHRFVLLEEHPRGFVPPFNSANLRLYTWALMRLALAVLGIVIVGGIVFSFIAAPMMAIGGGAIALVLLAGANIAVQWIVVRLGLIFPSAALGYYMRLGDSWAATKPVSSTILLPIIVIPLAFAILNFFVGLIPLLSLVLGLVLVWFQLLINLALLTTLYGNLIEGRRLN